MKNIRKPAVANAFYEGREANLREQIEECFLHKYGPSELPKCEHKNKRSIMGLVSPHAGYMYSGPAAACGFYEIDKEEKPDIIIILGPNHRGIGAEVAIMDKGAWQTPLGEVKIDEAVANEIAKFIKVEESAHAFEHSIEVQLPFLQYIYKELSFVPICMLDQSKATAVEIGKKLAEVLKDRNYLVIASSDFTHYEAHKVAQKKDKQAIEAICRLDVEELYSTIRKLDISACGYGPIAAMITCCKELGVKKGELIRYTTSGDISGDYSQVVGYASIKMVKE